MKTHDPFRFLLPNPPTHLRLWLYYAIAQIAAYLNAVGGADAATRFPFLGGYLSEMETTFADSSEPLPAAWGAALERWEQCRAADIAAFPLQRLGLSRAHMLALMLAGLVETDARFGAVYAALQPVPDETHLTVGLLDDLLRVSGHPLNGWGAASDLETRGLVSILRSDLPRAARSLSIPSVVWDACGGERPVRPTAGLHFHEASGFPTLESLTEFLPSDLAARVARLPELLRGGTINGVILRGMQGSGRLRALGAVACALNLGVLVMHRPDLQRLPELSKAAAPLAALLGALPVVEMELSSGETVTLPAFTSPFIGVILGHDGGVTGDSVESCLTLRIPPTRLDARRTGWQRILGGDHNGAVVAHISERFHLTIGGIEHAGKLALAYAALDGRTHVHLSDVQEACRAMNRQALDALATPIDTSGGSWDDLIVADTTRAELDTLALRCRHRETVLSSLGRGFNGANRGVRALFSGPSGTGKTLAARLLVAELGLDLYRVDLASVVNKYIGETERNLSRLFARAEEHDIVLLLDEGDALLTGRTDVRSSNDRYANLETNYLLQRLENYEGIIIITTNAPSRIDSAFQRRMDVTVEFTSPSAAQRYAIWTLHLPDNHAIDDAFLRLVAARCHLTGGQIRNASLHAAVLAVEYKQPLTPAFIVEAVAREYRKMGAASPLMHEMAGT